MTLFKTHNLPLSNVSSYSRDTNTLSNLFLANSFDLYQVYFLPIRGKSITSNLSMNPLYNNLYNNNFFYYFSFA